MKLYNCLCDLNSQLHLPPIERKDFMALYSLINTSSTKKKKLETQTPKGDKLFGEHRPLFPIVLAQLNQAIRNQELSELLLRTMLGGLATLIRDTGIYADSRMDTGGKELQALLKADDDYAWTAYEVQKKKTGEPEMGKEEFLEERAKKSRTGSNNSVNGYLEHIIKTDPRLRDLCKSLEKTRLSMVHNNKYITLVLWIKSLPDKNGHTELCHCFIIFLLLLHYFSAVCRAFEPQQAKNTALSRWMFSVRENLIPFRFVASWIIGPLFHVTPRWDIITKILKTIFRSALGLSKMILLGCIIGIPIGYFFQWCGSPGKAGELLFLTAKQSEINRYVHQLTPYEKSQLMAKRWYWVNALEGNYHRPGQPPTSRNDRVTDYLYSLAIQEKWPDRNAFLDYCLRNCFRLTYYNWSQRFYSSPPGSFQYFFDTPSGNLPKEYLPQSYHIDQDNHLSGWRKRQSSLPSRYPLLSPASKSEKPL